MIDLNGCSKYVDNSSSRQRSYSIRIVVRQRVGHNQLRISSHLRYGLVLIVLDLLAETACDLISLMRGTKALATTTGFHTSSFTRGAQRPYRIVEKSIGVAMML